MKKWMINSGLGSCALLVIIFANLSIANDNPDEQERDPLGCKNMGYRYAFNTVTFYPGLAPEADGDRQSLYFVHNKVARSVHLYQMLDDGSLNTLPFNHTIYGKQWAVLATGQKEQRYICTLEDEKSAYGQVIDCAKSLKICEYARVKFGLNNRGNYWVVQNNTRDGAVQEVLRYGIIPR